MDDPRLELAHNIMDMLRKHQEIQDVFLRGSMAAGTMDEFSDIDIGIDVSGSDNGVFAAEKLPNIMNQHFSVVFLDWAPSLLPKKYIQSYFLTDYSPFWFVDIECSATPHYQSVTKVQNDEIGHLIKLWVQTTKYHVRKHPSSPVQVRNLARRILSTDQTKGNSAELLQSILNEIDIINSNAHYEQLLESCFNVCNRLLWVR
ncbi:MAG: nucleotidyltransferase domain-containing protein [Bacillota bacterium]